jgi:hypothetical protein
MAQHRNRPRLRVEGTLTDEQKAKTLALKLHLTLAQVLGLIARFGIDSPRLGAAARTLQS